MLAKLIRIAQQSEAIMKKLFMAALIVAGLSGCATKETLTATHDVLKIPSKEQMQDCKIAPPPDNDAFVAAATDDRVKMLLDTLTTNYGYQADCNVQMKGLRDWTDQQTKLYQDKGTSTGDK